MKKLKSLLAALMCFVCAGSVAVFAACGDDDSSGGSSESSSSSTGSESSSSESTGSESSEGGGTSEVIAFTETAVTLEYDTTSGASASTLDLTDYLSTATTAASITWSSSDTSVATVSTSGVATATGAGTTTITATSANDSSVTATITLNVKAYEWVTTTMDMQTGYTLGYTSNGTIPSNYVSGRFTVNSGGRFESGSVISGSYNINTGGSATITFSLQGTGTTNSIAFNGKGASGSGTVATLTNTSTNTVYYVSQTIASGAYITADNYLDSKDSSVTVTYNSSYSASSPMLTISSLPAGDYTLSSSASLRISDLTIKEYLEVSAPASITASATTTDFLEGDTFSATGLAVTLNYANGSTETLTSSDYTTALYSDSNCTQSVDATSALASGTYYVQVTDSANGFTDTYEIAVYALDSIALGLNGTVYVGKGTSSDYASSYNGVYYNQSVKTVYTNGEAYDDTGLTVIATGVLNGTYVDFILDDDWYSIDSSALTNLTATTVDCNVDISVTVTADSTTKTASYSVSYVNTAISYDSTSNVAYIAVDDDYNGVEGALVDNEGTNCNTFSTINKALEYLKIQQSANNISSSTTKIIAIAAGYYNEKVEVTLANVHMVGAGSTASSSTAITTITDTEKNAGTYTIIEWDSLYGQEDESGYTQVTDSTATFNVRQSATGFYAAGITFSNWYNCVANFANVSHSEHRALAMLIQADQVTLSNCALLGYQDTLELFTGRQYLTNCFISGTTDFIFGTNNTTFFTGCTIYSITAETSSGATSSDGGYITAFKGYNSSSSDNVDYVTYGAIFYNCTFTAAENVLANGNTAIGRTWGAYAAVAVINCTLGSHISTDGYSSTNSTNSNGQSTGSSGSYGSKNLRYVRMSGVEPTADTVKFVEYGNTGEGAISEAVAGMTMLDATTAANYYNLSVIFGTTNGAVTYDAAWSIFA